MVDSVDAIITAFGGVSRFGAAVGTTPQAASNMRARGSIPAERWTRVVAEAAMRGIPGVTLEALAAIAAKPRDAAADGSAAGPTPADSAPVPEAAGNVNAPAGTEPDEAGLPAQPGQAPVDEREAEGIPETCPPPIGGISPEAAE